MEKELRMGLIAALENKPSANFSAEDVNTAALNGLLKEIGLTSESDARTIRAHESEAFALIEEAVDEILPKKLEGVLGEFAEVKQFGRTDEVVFNIEKIGRGRAKLTISKGARGGIYRAARLDNKHFGLATSVETVAVYVTLEELILGTISLGELFQNILEGFEERVYIEVFKALAAGKGVTNAVTAETGKNALSGAIDKVLPKVKQYGIPTIFGSYQGLASLSNEAITDHPELEDSADRRNYGLIRLYKGCKVVELPNYLVTDATEKEDWAYDPKYVFVMPSGAKPVKVALRGDLVITKNVQAVGSEKWEASKMIGVGVAMANNYAVISINDLN